jgi:diadenosine tetraphosphatase ApaH/serine/threonine PP2A family protein phosphatase
LARYGVFSDIHGNLEALNEVLKDMEKEGCKKYWCVGDLVGYGANPNECIEKVRALADITVLGNHDSACVGLEDTSNFNQYARKAVDWTAGQIAPYNKDWLQKLPYTAVVDGVLLVHASPSEPRAWRYMLTISDMLRGFKAMEGNMAFIGHSHQPLILINRGEDFFSINGEEYHVEDGVRCIVNVGSVGQPRDGVPDASYAIWEPDTRTILLKRVGYDVATAQRKIREAGLPDILASRLETGN